MDIRSSSELLFATTARELRRKAIDCLNSDLNSDSNPIEEDRRMDEELTIHPQSMGGWTALVLVLILVLTSIYLWSSSGPLFVRVLAALACLVPALAMLFVLLVKPVEIRFISSSRKMTVVSRLGGLFHKARTYSFDDMESIKSSLRATGDNDPGVFLELLLKNGDRLDLKRASPDWSSSAPLLSYSGYLEPKEIETLRQKIASLIGVKDQGFHR
jgi:hypothetical protein